MQNMANMTAKKVLLIVNTVMKLTVILFHRHSFGCFG